MGTALGVPQTKNWMQDIMTGSVRRAKASMIGMRAEKKCRQTSVRPEADVQPLRETRKIQVDKGEPGHRRFDRLFPRLLRGQGRRSTAMQSSGNAL